MVGRKLKEKKERNDNRAKAICPVYYRKRAIIYPRGRQKKKETNYMIIAISQICNSSSSRFNVQDE